MERGIRFAKHIITSGLVVPGHLGDEEGFQPWPLAPAEAADRVAAEWRRLGEPVPRPGDIAWLECTPKGEEHARNLLSHHDD